MPPCSCQIPRPEPEGGGEALQRARRGFPDFNPDVLLAAKRGLYGALAAESEREFLCACIQSCAPIFSVAFANATADMIDDGVMVLSESLVENSDAVLALLQKSPTLAPIADILAPMLARAKVARAGLARPLAEHGHFAHPVNGEYVIRPCSDLTEYADRSEIRVALPGCDPKTIALTHSEDGYYLDALSAMPVVAYAATRTCGCGGAVSDPSARLRFRGSVSVFAGVHHMLSRDLATKVTWDAKVEELVLTFARKDVARVTIEPTPIANDPTPAVAARRAAVIGMIALILLAGPDSVGLDVPGGTASDPEGKAHEIAAWLPTLDDAALEDVLIDVVKRTVQSYPERKAAVVAALDALPPRA